VIVSLIVALDEAGGIGRAGNLPWRLSTDLQRFKTLTMGHHLVMGRKTFETVGRPLPGRTTIVVTRRQDYAPPACLIAHSLDSALALARAGGESEVFVCGGGQIYALALPLADRIYLTRVHARLPADTFFPPLNLAEWQITQRIETPAGDKDDYPATFTLLERLTTSLAML